MLYLLKRVKECDKRIIIYISALFRSNSSSLSRSRRMEVEGIKHFSSEPSSALFKSNKISQKYVQFRPNYTPETYQKIYEFCRESPRFRSSRSSSLEFDLAVDIGCGSGQSSVPLTKYFKQVVGVDISENQLAHAPSNVPALSFRQSEADDISFIETGTADLITAAQAFHWFQKEKFFQEVDRLLKPGGSLVIYGYGLPILENEEAEAYKCKIYSDVLGQYWAEGRKYIESEYASVTLPYEGWKRDDSLVMEKVWNVEQLVGYIASWSATNKFLTHEPESTLLSDMLSEFLKLYTNPDQPTDSMKVKISWSIFLLMGHKPL